ncbi:hypothetical protein KR222_007496, partial [Zaprionus bogoriensis]
KMILRPLHRVLRPPSVSDAGCFLLIAIFVPATYIFQVTIVIPELCALGSFLYTFLWLGGLFVLFNLTSNWLAAMLVDTTIKSKYRHPPQDVEQLRRWHMCDCCQALVPPRSWHCEICNVCVLKRDHHCRFTCCCIGHHNYRYFFFFLLYMSIGSLITLITTSIYMWHLHVDYYWSPSTLLALLVPALSFTLYASWENFYIFIYELNILAFGISTLLLCYHAPMFSRGAVMKQRNSSKYNYGLRRNAELVLGRRMHLAWLSPFVRSELPHDGINWAPSAQKTE